MLTDFFDIFRGLHYRGLYESERVVRLRREAQLENLTKVNAVCQADKRILHTELSAASVTIDKLTASSDEQIKWLLADNETLKGQLAGSMNDNADLAKALRYYQDELGDTPEEALIYALNLGDGGTALYFRLQLLLDDYFRDDSVVVEPVDMDAYRAWFGPNAAIAIHNNGGQTIQMTDSKYLGFASAEDLRKAVSAAWIHYLRYEAEYNDCDDFIKQLIAFLQRVYGATNVSYTESQFRDAVLGILAHAFGSAWCGQDGEQIIEPQNKSVMSADTENEWYKVENWRLHIH